MQCILNNNILTIKTNETQVYYRLQQIVDKNFPYRVGSKNKIIIFANQKDDLHQKRYFLKLVTTIYKNYESDEAQLQELQNAFDKTIKIELNQTNQILQQLKIELLFHNEKAILSLDSDNKMVIIYLKNYFKEHTLEYDKRAKTITIYPKNSNFIPMLEQLLNQKIHLAWIFEFKYNEQDFEKFRAKLEKNFIKLEKFCSLQVLLKEHFDTLGCEPSDTHEKVRKNYLELVKLYHPDRHANASEEKKSTYKELFGKVQYAYEMLKNYYQNDESWVSA